MDLPQWALALTVGMPFLGVLFILLLRNSPNAREAASLTTATLTFLLTALSLPSAFASIPASTPAVVIFPGFSLQLAADALGLLFACLASLLWIITTIYNIGYMRGLREHAQTRYYACFAIVIGAIMGIALSSNLFSLFVFYEILTVATYPLIIHKETPEAFAAGLKYLVYTWSGGVAILAGMLILLSMGNTLDFVAGGNAGIATIAPGFARLAFLLLMAGFGVKAALVPIHGWLPSAMIAPTPVSGLLHAVAVVNAGVFGLLRLMLYLYGPGLMTGLGLQNVVIAAAVVTIIVGSLLALLQDDFKLRLAYSTVSQLSYMVLGAAVLLPPGISGVTDAGRAAAVIGATYAFIAHAFGKLTMFFVAGAVSVETGRTRISQLNGIGRKMPREFIAFTLATLSMAGLPPMAGFVAKWYLSLGAWNAGDWWILLVLAGSGVLNLAYFLPIIIRAFFRPSEGEIHEARWSLGGPVLATAAGALILGLWTGIPGSPFMLSAQIAAQVTRTAILLPGTLVLGTAVPPFLIFLIGAPLVLALKGRMRQIGLVALGGIALIDVLLLPGGYFTGPAAGVLQWQLPFMGYTLTLLRVDSLSYLMGVIFAIITFLAILYASAVASPRLHLFALLYAGTSLGAVFAGDWITLLIFWELMAITSTFLIWQKGGEAIGAGYRYLLFHGLGGALLGAGIAMLYLGGGSPLVGPLSGIPNATYQMWASVFILLGIGVNVGFIPLHTWLPDSYPRANFVASVFLSVYTTKAAVYLLARAQPGTEIIAFMGALMAVFGVSFAIFQNDMRRLLSYHIISQVGYMVAGVGLFGWLGAANEIGQLGLSGGMAHVFNHILYKALLFMVVGVIIWKTGHNTLSRLGGLQRKMPVTAIAFWVAAFSISGMPLFNGFISKGMVLLAAEHTNLWLWVLLEIASFGTFLSFLKLGYFAFLRPGDTEASDPPLPMQAAMIGTAILCIAIGVYPAILYPILPVHIAFQAYDPLHVAETLLILGAAAAFFFTVGKRLLEPHDTRLRDADVLYRAAGKALVTVAGGLQSAFRAIYHGAKGAAVHGLDSAGRFAMRMDEMDVNWNLAGIALGGLGLLIALLAGNIRVIP
ncbi:MAG: Na(+)/H(+) antiporter subunit D [Methanomicrobiales archaeon]|jgi:formate hydrogenlyase subunit 3/multisubunit Na+/H+ antiporter MnhD subunit